MGPSAVSRSNKIRNKGLRDFDIALPLAPHAVALPLNYMRPRATRANPPKGGGAKLWGLPHTQIDRVCHASPATRQLSCYEEGQPCALRTTVAARFRAPIAPDRHAGIKFIRQQRSQCCSQAP